MAGSGSADAALEPTRPRPDLKQLVWILTVSADGAVPLAYRLADGNTVDDPTHVPTWDGLVGLLGRTDFLYVADSKLCSRAAMGHLDSRGGRFVTVMPRSRAEDGAFRDHLQTHAPVWIEAIRLPGVRQGDPDRVYSTTAAPLPSAEGYRIVWVHSTDKASRDARARAGRIDAGVAAIEALEPITAKVAASEQDPHANASTTAWPAAACRWCCGCSRSTPRPGSPNTSTPTRPTTTSTAPSPDTCVQGRACIQTHMCQPSSRPEDGSRFTGSGGAWR